MHKRRRIVQWQRICQHLVETVGNRGNFTGREKAANDQEAIVIEGCDLFG